MTKYQLSKSQAEDVFFNCLCDNDIFIHSLQWMYSKKSYEVSKQKLMEMYKGSTPCYEDVLMQILKDGGKLGIIDLESDCEVYHVTLADIHEKINECPIDQLMNVLNEEYDVSDTDVIIQTIFFGEVIYC
jgi:hypothetical protein